MTELGPFYNMKSPEPLSPNESFLKLYLVFYSNTRQIPIAIMDLAISTKGFSRIKPTFIFFNFESKQIISFFV